MSWIRIGDEFNGAPEWMKAQEIAAQRGDDRLVNELKGAALALYTYSAQQWTDYIVTYGAAVTYLGLTRVEPVIADLIETGILTDVSTDTQRQYKLLERKTFVHLIRSDEKEKNSKRRRDRRRGSLMVPVLMRDGAQCRYCGNIVDFDDTRSDKGAEMDHRTFQEETTPDNYVVACRGCNQMRVDLGDRADIEIPLEEAPDEPIWNDQVLRRLSRWRRLVEAESRRLGIPNPLTRGTVEARPPIQPPAGDTEHPATPRQPSTPSSGPADNQPAGVPQLPQDSRKVADRGRAAKETPPRRAASSAISAPVHPLSPEPADDQLARDPQDESEPPARASRPANEAPDSVRKRRRRRRR